MALKGIHISSVVLLVICKTMFNSATLDNCYCPEIRTQQKLINEYSFPSYFVQRAAIPISGVCNDTHVCICSEFLQDLVLGRLAHDNSAVAAQEVDVLVRRKIFGLGSKIIKHDKRGFRFG